MKNRVQSSRLSKPWGFFILSRGALSRTVAALTCGGVIWCWVLAFPASAVQGDSMKRRQQGILTGMPFMANIAPRTFVDDLGRKLYLANPPKRIVSLAPSITEMLFAIGLDEEIVGVTDFCNFPPAALTKPKIAYSQPNLEAMLALQPQLVLAPPSFIRPDFLAKLEQLKVPTFILESKTVEGILGHLQLLGRMVGHASQANEQAAKLRKEIGELTRTIEGLPRPTLLYVLNSEPLITVGPGSFIHHLIEMAGGRNAAERASAPYPRLTMEEVLTQNPDMLLFPVGEYEGIPQAEQDRWKRWQSLTAVREGNLFQIQSDLLNRPGPRVLDGLRELVRILHPDAAARETPPTPSFP
jgi:iron complex transport system substrate-binding protein